MSQLISVIHGFEAVFIPTNFMFMIFGFLTGVIFAAIPGLTGTLAIALLLPITYSLDVETSLIMVAAIFMGGQYGGSITAITVNIPGAPCSVMTAYEGNKLMRRGKGVLALRHAALASAIGGVLGAIMLMALAPVVARASLYVQTPGKFSLILFALFIIIISHKEALAKGIVATVLGLMVASIGIDVASPIARQTFGYPNLIEGVNLMAMLIGAFAVSELLLRSEPNGEIVADAELSSAPKVKRSDFLPRFKDFKTIGMFNYAKFAIIGYFVGVLPGAGGSSAAFVSYAEAKRASAKPEEYGKGSFEGVAAAEGANNAMCGGSLVPMLTFGIPGDTTSAVILGVLIINGLAPGPQLMSTQFDLVTPMMASLFFSALLIPITLVLIGPYYLKLVSISKAILFSGIAAVSMIGAYVSTYSPFQMGTALVVGVAAYLLQKKEYPIVSFLLGFILGPDLEIYMRRSLTLSDGDPMIFVTSPDSVFFLALIGFFFYFMVLKKNKPASQEPV
ncbi:MAG: tricarboxylate transporter [Blastopirellula sp.]|nr:MAG: tricarboxylate transporter [Blastopirellula sp.]